MEREKERQTDNRERQWASERWETQRAWERQIKERDRETETAWEGERDKSIHVLMDPKFIISPEWQNCSVNYPLSQGISHTPQTYPLSYIPSIVQEELCAHTYFLKKWLDLRDPEGQLLTYSLSYMQIHWEVPIEWLLTLKHRACPWDGVEWKFAEE